MARSREFISIAVLAALLCVISYLVPRNEFFLFLGLYSAAFAAYLLLVVFKKVKASLWSGLLLRLALLLATPNLSDDFYRFLWDGFLTLNGFNAFAYIPAHLLDNLVSVSDKIDSNYLYQLYDSMNSQYYHSIYPPVNQLVFATANLAAPSIFGSIVIIKLFIIVAEVATFAGLKKLLQEKKRSDYLINIYWLNPLIILEFSGNLHFEAILICFLLWSIIWLRHRLLLSALLFGMAVCTKLWPLMFMPLLWGRLGLKKFTGFAVVVGAVILLAFVPLIDHAFIYGLSSSVDLYFRHFAFNAALFYGLQSLGLQLTAIDYHGLIGPVLAISAFLLIITYSFFKRNSDDLVKSLAVVFTIYLAMATTVHPWYVSLLVVFAVYTRHWYAIGWSYLVFLSYFTYSQPGYQESMRLIALEYLLIAGLMFFDFKRKV